MLKAQHAVFKTLNQKFPVKLCGIGMPRGMTRRIDPSGTYYYSNDGRKFESFTDCRDYNSSLRSMQRK